MKAKPTSLVSQIVAAVWIAVWSTFKFIKADNPIIEDIVMSGIAIAACFTPVYFSIIMDKIRSVRFGEDKDE